MFPSVLQDKIHVFVARSMYRSCRHHIIQLPCSELGVSPFLRLVQCRAGFPSFFSALGGIRRFARAPQPLIIFVFFRMAPCQGNSISLFQQTSIVSTTLTQPAINFATRCHSRTFSICGGASSPPLYQPSCPHEHILQGGMSRSGMTRSRW